MKEESGTSSGRHRRWWYLLLLVPFVVLSALPWFNHVEPRLFGLPFFWWFQFLWVPISACLTAIVYFATEGKDDQEEPR